MPKEKKVKLGKVVKIKSVPLGFLGGKKIEVINKKMINGKEFNDVILEDGTGYLLSDKDLEAQVKAKL